jgi:hypothetical protein
MQLSVSTVYSALKDIANKDQRGFITPDVFNNFAQPAQLALFTKMLDSVRRKRRVRQGQIDGGFSLSALKRIKEDLGTFVKRSAITFSAGYAERPSDFAYAISAVKGDGTPVDISSNEDKTPFLLRSTLGAPTTTAPTLTVTNILNIYPSDTGNVLLTYYKSPSGVTPAGVRTLNPPSYAYVMINDVEMFDPVNSVDFELPDFYLPYLLIELSRMAGIHLRDRDLMLYTQIQEKENDVMTTE